MRISGTVAVNDIVKTINTGKVCALVLSVSSSAFDTINTAFNITYIGQATRSARKCNLLELFIEQLNLRVETICMDRNQSTDRNQLSANCFLTECLRLVDIPSGSRLHTGAHVNFVLLTYLELSAQLGLSGKAYLICYIIHVQDVIINTLHRCLWCIVWHELLTYTLDWRIQKIYFRGQTMSTASLPLPNHK